MPIPYSRVINFILLLFFILISCEDKPLNVEDKNLPFTIDTVSFDVIEALTYQTPPVMAGSSNLYLGSNDEYEFEFDLLRFNKFSNQRYDPFTGSTVGEFHDYNDSSLTVDSLTLTLNFIDSTFANSIFSLRYFPNVSDSVFSRNRTNYLNYNTNYSDVISFGTISHDTSNSYSKLNFNIDTTYFAEFIDTSKIDFNNSFLVEVFNTEQDFYEFYSMNSGENTSPSLSVYFTYIINDSTTIDTFNVHSAVEDLSILKPVNLIESDTSNLSVSLAKGLKSLIMVDTKEWQLPKGSIIRKSELVLFSLDNDTSNSIIINSYPLNDSKFPDQFTFYENEPFDYELSSVSSSTLKNNELKFNHRIGSNNFFEKNKSIQVFNIQPSVTNNPFTTINFYNSNHIEFFPKLRITYVIP